MPTAMNIMNRLGSAGHGLQTGINSGPQVQQSIPKALGTDKWVTKAFTSIRLFAMAGLQAEAATGCSPGRPGWVTTTKAL